MKTKSSRFDRLVAQYYPAVYSFAARFTDDPREAVALTRDAFSSARKQARNLRNPTRDCDRPDLGSHPCGTCISLIAPFKGLPGRCELRACCLAWHQAILKSIPICAP